MRSQTIFRVIGGVLLLIGLLTFFKIADEAYTGLLTGSRSYGLNVDSNPIAFYVSLIMEGLIAAFFVVAGVSLLRYRK